MQAREQPVRHEHAVFHDHVAHIRHAAREVPDRSPEERSTLVGQILDFLHGELVPHAEAEERGLYAEVDRILDDPRATAAMRLEHRQIRRLVEGLADIDPGDGPALQEALYAIHALVESHLEKEEELYLPLVE